MRSGAARFARKRMIYAAGAILIGFLITLTVIDIQSFRLPNALTFPLIGLGLIYAYFMADFKAALIGAALGYILFFAVEHGFKYFRGIDGLGRGDAKLLAAGGAWCGWMAIPHIILMASLLGIALAILLRFGGKAITSQTAIPFGPFLAFAIAVVWSVNTFYISAAL